MVAAPVGMYFSEHACRFILVSAPPSR